MRCCDTIFLPSIYFTNADAFPEDREIGYSIDTTANGAVVWESTVHAFFYQVGGEPGLVNGSGGPPHLRASSCHPLRAALEPAKLSI